MENGLSAEVEEIPDALWGSPEEPQDQQQQQQQHPVEPQEVAGDDGGGGGGAADDGEGVEEGAGGAMDQDNMAAEEWSFERILEEALLNGVGDDDAAAAEPDPEPEPEPGHDVALHAADGGDVDGVEMEVVDHLNDTSPEPLAPVVEEALLLNGGGDITAAAAAEPGHVVALHAAAPVVSADGGAGGGGDGSIMEMMEAADRGNGVSPAPAAEETAVDPLEYNAALKRKLAEDLAAVAVWRTSGAKQPKRSQGSNNYAEGSKIQNADIHGKQAISFSSGEPSPTGDNDDYGEVDILGFMFPEVEKVRKRKESNRESARRSRDRKAAHLKDIEDQVVQLRVENSSLLRRLASLNQKYHDATADIRVLKADNDTLRAKVKMAEDILKRVAGMRPVPATPIVADNSYLSMHFGGSPSDVAAAIHDYFATPSNASVNNNNPMSNMMPCLQAEGTGNGSLTARKINQIAQHAIAIEHLKKAICGMPTSSGSVPWGSPSLGQNDFANMKMP
ncbi:hypothetical protein ACP4OV_011670 [Aristida adscensionis]